MGRHRSDLLSLVADHRCVLFVYLHIANIKYLFPVFFRFLFLLIVTLVLVCLRSVDIERPFFAIGHPQCIVIFLESLPELRLYILLCRYEVGCLFHILVPSEGVVGLCDQGLGSLWLHDHRLILILEQGPVAVVDTLA